MKENWKLPSLALAVTLLSATSVYALERAAPIQLAQGGPDDQRGGGGPGGGGRERGGGGEEGGGGGKARGGGGGEEGGGRPERPGRQERQERQGGGGGGEAGEPPERPARPAREPDAEPAPKKAPAPAARDEQPPAPKKERPPRDDADEAPAKKVPPPVEKAAPPVEKKAPPPEPKAEPEPKAVPKEAPKAAPKEEPEPKVIPKEAPKAAPKEEPKAGGPKDEPVPGKKFEPKEPGPKGAEPAGEPKGEGLPPSGKEPRGDRKGPDGKGPEGKGPEGKGPEGKGPEGKQPGEPKGPPGAPPIRDGKAPEAGPPGAGGPAAAPSEVKDLKELKEERKERTEDGGKRVIIEEPDKRSIVKEGGQTIIRHDETERFRRLDQGKIRREKRNGLDISISLGVGGIEIYTETDDRGRSLRRYRRDREGREVILFDNRDYYRRHNDGSFVDAIVDLPPPRIGIPRERYILDYEEASDIDVYETLSAPPVEELDRTYSMEEVRRSPMLRDRMPRVDLDAINFEFGAWEVTRDQYPALERVAKAMRRVIDRDPGETFLIEGHTDAVGSDEDNLSLSDRRAESVAIILTEQFGVPAENLTTQGYGEQYLKVNTQAAERQNRRVAVRRVTPLLSRTSGR